MEAHLHHGSDNIVDGRGLEVQADFSRFDTVDVEKVFDEAIIAQVRDMLG